MKTMLTFFSLTGLCSIMDLYSVPRIETFFVEDLWFRVLHRVSVSSSNGCVRLRWLFERFKYRGCLELWIDGRKPGAGFDFNSEIAFPTGAGNFQPNRREGHSQIGMQT